MGVIGFGVLPEIDFNASVVTIMGVTTGRGGDRRERKKGGETGIVGLKCNLTNTS